MRFLIYLGLFHWLSLCCKAQNSYPQKYFKSPVDTVIILAGNFGEIRPNHFHAGLDIKTGGKEGMKIYAVAAGYVSRIKVSAFGYGKALYITHPNGYVSVYAHLKSFTDSIEKYVKQNQHEKEVFEIELYPFKQQFRVKQGDLIALSGNTGSSEGPHLHFEIRDGAETPINPLLFGLNVADTIKPFITGIAIYPLDKNSMVNRKNSPKKIKPPFKNKIYTLKPADSIVVSGVIGFGIEAYDRENKTSGKNGAYSIQLYKNNELIYSHKLDKVSFDDTRYINAHIDYPEKIRINRNIQRSFILKNNKLKIYGNVKSGGRINFNSTGESLMKYVVTDISGNKDSIEFKVKSTEEKIHFNTDTAKYLYSKKYFDCEKENEFSLDNISVKFPGNTFYEDFEFTYFMNEETVPGSLSPTHYLHNNYTPLHNYYELKIKCPLLSYTLQKKALIASVYGKSHKVSEGGTYENGYVTTKTRTFGKFIVALDTIPPVIKPMYFPKNKVLTKGIFIKITDNLSGIKTYRGTIDGKWILMEFDNKSKMLSYIFDDSISSGKHFFELETTDEKDNVSNYKIEFIKQKSALKGAPH